MRKVCVFTGTRAEFGLLRPVMERIQAEASLDLQILASGMHLSPEFGLTWREIEAAGLPVHEKVEMLTSSDTAVGLCKSMGLGLCAFPEALERLSPDVLVILGDRFEAFSAAAAAMICRVPIAHLHGGEATHGLIDEPIRHAITKMSHLHFTSTEAYRRRVIQLGEDPRRVFNVGALGVENIRRLELVDRDELATDIGFSLDEPYVMVTFHPVTLERATAGEQFGALLEALDAKGIRAIFTKANADTDGRVINRMIDDFVACRPGEAVGFTSLGLVRYLSALRGCAAAVGNSSSGILEAPALEVPTVNIGDRQNGRVKPRSVIDCAPEAGDLGRALDAALAPAFKASLAGMEQPYEKRGTSRRIVEVLREFDLRDILKKRFHDLPIPEGRAEGQ